MAGPVYQAPLSRMWGEQLSLTTTRASKMLPPGYHYVGVYTSLATDFRLGFGVVVKGVYYYDASEAVGSRYKNITAAMLDKTTVGSGTNLDGGATGDRLYVCLEDAGIGIYIDIVAGSPNGAASGTMTCNYRKNDDTWATTAATDGTNDLTRSLAQDGEVVFTRPTDWKRAVLGGPSNPIDTSNPDAPALEGFWLQILWSAALDSDVEIENIWGLPVDTNYGYFDGSIHYIFPVDRRNVGAIAALLGAGTDTLNIDYLKAVQ